MTAGSFDIDTSRKMVGDERARVIEAQARSDADIGVFAPPVIADQASSSYWDRCAREFEAVVYSHQHARRLERIKRKAQQQAGAA